MASGGDGARRGGMEQHADIPPTQDADSAAAAAGQWAILRELPTKDIARRAREAGVPDDDISDAAQDSDSPKEALIQLLMEQLTPAHAEGHDAAAALRAELEGLKSKELARRAREEGVSQDAIFDAQDTTRRKKR